MTREEAAKIGSDVNAKNGRTRLYDFVKENYDEKINISEYIDCRHPVKIKCNKCGHEKLLHVYSIKHCALRYCEKCGPTIRDTEDLAKWVPMIHGAKYELVGEFRGMDIPTEIRCKQCGSSFYITPYEYFCGKHNKTLCKTPTCRPHGKEANSNFKLAYKSYESTFDLITPYKNMDTKIRLKCKTCNYEFDVWPQKVIHQQEIRCPRCSDGISLPNRFLRSLFDVVGIRADFEFYVLDVDIKRFYDAHYSTSEGNEILIEMDGGMSHGDSECFGVTVAEQINNDIYKDNLASKLGMQLIRIDCKYGACDNPFSYMKKSILSSPLYKMMSLNESIIDEAIIRTMGKSKIEEAANVWNNGEHVYTNIGNVINVSKAAVSAYIQIADKCGLLNNYDSEEQSHEMHIKNHRSKSVMCVETGEIFYSMNNAAHKHNTSVCQIKKCINGNAKHAGTSGDGNKLTWQYVDHKSEDVYTGMLCQDKYVYGIFINNRPIYFGIGDGNDIFDEHNENQQLQYLCKKQKTQKIILLDHLSLHKAEKEQTKLICEYVFKKGYGLNKKGYRSSNMKKYLTNTKFGCGWKSYVSDSEIAKRKAEVLCEYVDRYPTIKNTKYNIFSTPTLGPESHVIYKDDFEKLVIIQSFLSNKNSLNNTEVKSICTQLQQVTSNEHFYNKYLYAELITGEAS